MPLRRPDGHLSVKRLRATAARADGNGQLDAIPIWGAADRTVCPWDGRMGGPSSGVPGEAGGCADDARGLDAPGGLDGAVQGVMGIGSGHCYRSHRLSIRIDRRAGLICQAPNSPAPADRSRPPVGSCLSVPCVGTLHRCAPSGLPAMASSWLTEGVDEEPQEQDGEDCLRCRKQSRSRGTWSYVPISNRCGCHATEVQQFYQRVRIPWQDHCCPAISPTGSVG